MFHKVPKTHRYDILSYIIAYITNASQFRKKPLGFVPTFIFSNASHLMPQHLCSSRSPLSCDMFDSIDISYLNPLRGMLSLCHITQEFSANWLTFNHCRCHSLLLLILCPAAGHLLMTFVAFPFCKCSF